MLNSTFMRVTIILAVLLAGVIHSAFAQTVGIQNVWLNIDGKDTISILTEKCRITDMEMSNDDKRLTVRMTGNAIYTWTNVFDYSSDIIAEATLVNESEKNTTLQVCFKKPVRYDAIVMHKPDRLQIKLTDLQFNCVNHYLTDGVFFKVIDYRIEAGKVRAYVLDVEPNSCYKLETLLDGKIPGRTRLSRFANSPEILAAVNGSYFASDGEIIGVMKNNGCIISSDRVPRAVAGFGADGQLVVEITAYHGEIIAGDKRVTIDYVNRLRYDNQLILYNKAYGERTATNVFGVEYIIVDGKIVGISNGNSVIPSNGCVLSANGSAADKLSGLKLGDFVTIEQTLGKDIDACADAIGAGPQLIRDGKLMITAAQEHILPDIAFGRAPRTAIAQTFDKHILLVVIDGRQRHSIGMTLTELGEFLLKNSAERAMNLDGGGSSAILVHGRVLSLPSDGSERAIASAVAFVRKT